VNELDDLIDRIQAPSADVAADVARGERALRRRHRWQGGAASLAVVAVTGVGVALSGAGGTPQAGFATQPGQSAASRSTGTHTADQRHARAHHRRAAVLKQQTRRLQHQASVQYDSSVLRTYHDVLAEHLDPTGRLLRLAQNEQSGGGVIGTKLDWRDGGMLEIVVSHRWGAASGFYLLGDAGMRATTYDGHPARVSTTGDDLVVSVEHSDGTVVTLIASTGFGNNGTSTASLGLTQDQLLAAASDERLTLPASMR
jgi:hypothetical protein